MSLWDIASKIARGAVNTASHMAEQEIKQQKKKEGVGTRRTDNEIYSDKRGMNKAPESYQVVKKVFLNKAITMANSEPGVYVLYLNGQVMKCGRAVYCQGVRWRMKQYYSLKYDARAQAGDYWAINKNNRDKVVVSWQCCPPAACKELEYKLFKKYGKGPWALRAPENCSTDEWKLLI